MLILGIETATERVGAGLIGSDGIIAAFDVARGRHHAEILMPAVEFVLRHGDAAVGELSAIVVDVGPGLFTGMRVGLATARAMSQALAIPLIGVTSLEVVAFSCRPPSAEDLDASAHDDRVIASVIDARKGQVFFGFHRVTSDGVVTLGEPRAGSVAEVIAAIEERGQRILCVGDGMVKYRSELDNHPLIAVADHHLAHPNVRDLCIIGMRRALREQWSVADDVRAVYLRAPDAEINWSTRPSSLPVEIAP